MSPHKHMKETKQQVLNHCICDEETLFSYTSYITQ